MMASLDLRTIRRALGVLERLPGEALADLAERIVDRLDEAEPDPAMMSISAIERSLTEQYTA